MNIEREDLPVHYVTNAGEQIELTANDWGGYCVDCWTGEDDNRWSRSFDKFEDAIAEYERWYHLQPAISQAKD